MTARLKGERGRSTPSLFARAAHIIAQARTLSSMGRLTAALGVSRPNQPAATDAGQDHATPRTPCHAMSAPVAPKAAVPAKNRRVEIHVTEVVDAKR